MIKILIADDHDIVREGLARILDLHDDMEIVGEASTGRQAVGMCHELQPDVVLLDLDMPEMDGIEATRQITSSMPGTKVLILTMHDTEEHAARALKAGASGYMLKGASRGALPEAIRKITAGEKSINPDVMSKLAMRAIRPNGDSGLAALSDREMQILTLTARGLTLNEIADNLNLAVSTVFTYKKRLRDKLGVSKDVELLNVARRNNLLEDS